MLATDLIIWLTEMVAEKGNCEVTDEEGAPILTVTYEEGEILLSPDASLESLVTTAKHYE